MEIPVLPLTTRELREYLSEYSSPESKIQEMERDGELIRLRRGLYVLAAEGRNDYLTANRIYASSYVSCESALGFSRFMPEQEGVMKSVTTLRCNQFKNNAGLFSYRHVPELYFDAEVRALMYHDNIVRIATPEKAIADLLLLTPGLRLRYRKDALEFVHGRLRIEMRDIIEMNDAAFERLAGFGRKRESLMVLAETIRWIKKSSKQ